MSGIVYLCAPRNIDKTTSWFLSCFTEDVCDSDEEEESVTPVSTNQHLTSNSLTPVQTLSPIHKSVKLDEAGQPHRYLQWLCDARLTCSFIMKIWILFWKENLFMYFSGPALTYNTNSTRLLKSQCKMFCFPFDCFLF